MTHHYKHILQCGKDTSKLKTHLATRFNNELECLTGNKKIIMFSCLLTLNIVPLDLIMYTLMCILVCLEK